jgi:hypothetical protein
MKRYSDVWYERAEGGGCGVFELASSSPVTCGSQELSREVYTQGGFFAETI